MSELYSKSREASKAIGEKRDCAVIAISIFCDVSYNEAHEALARAGRKPGHGTYRFMQAQAVRELTGKNFVAHDVEEKFWVKEKTEFERNIRSKYPEKYNTKNLTVKQIEKFPEAWAHIKNALIFVRGHVLCLRDGVVHDWSKGKRMHIEEIWIMED